MDLYTVTFLITAFALTITAMDVTTNRLIVHKNKYEIIAVCIVIFIASLCEYIGKKTNGAPIEFTEIHRIAKLIEFCISPCIGIVAAKAYGKLRNKKLMEYILVLHAVFEIIAVFNGWTFSIDAGNLYHREKFYWVYITVFLISIICCYICIMEGNKQYQARLGIVNIAILAFLSFGIGVQMIYSEMTIDFMCVAMGSFFLYHHRGNIVNQIDVMTRLLNRRCFERSIENISSPAYVLIFDVNNFKTINDTLGHAEGDNCLKQVAGTIFASYGKNGFCYRIGGDEFCVIMNKNLDKLKSFNDKFSNSINELRKKYGNIFGVSFGYAYYDNVSSKIDTVIKQADEMMYTAKRNK